MKSQRVLAFLVLSVFPPVALVACGGLFGNKDADAGVDAAVASASSSAVVAVVIEDAAAPLESAAAVKPGVVVHHDAGVHDAGVVHVDSGIPTPNPNGNLVIPVPSASFRIPTLPSGMKMPAGFPSKYIPR